jgi:hypothetical protein
MQYAFPLLFSCLDQLDFLQDYLCSHLIRASVSINFYKGEVLGHLHLRIHFIQVEVSNFNATVVTS